MTGARQLVVGFVGAGAMGGPMVARLSAAGHRVTVTDTEPARLATLAELPGVNPAAALAGLGACDLVICMLPSSAAVAAVVSGPGGLLETLGRGSQIIDMGSSAPQRTVELSRLAAGLGIDLVDAPVSGGVGRAKTGELTIMFGGNPTQLERCRRVLEALGNNIIAVGPVGSGHAMKALNNLLSAIGLAAASEVVEVGRRFGLDPHVMLEVLNQSTGRNHATETKIGQFVLSGTFASGFALQLMLKDLTTAVELARAEGVEIPLGEACLQLWRHAAEVLPADSDHTRIALLPAGIARVAS